MKRVPEEGVGGSVDLLLDEIIGHTKKDQKMNSVILKLSVASAFSTSLGIAHSNRIFTIRLNQVWSPLTFFQYLELHCRISIFSRSIITGLNFYRFASFCENSEINDSVSKMAESSWRITTRLVTLYDVISNKKAQPKGGFTA